MARNSVREIHLLDEFMREHLEEFAARDTHWKHIQLAANKMLGCEFTDGVIQTKCELFGLASALRAVRVRAPAADPCTVTTEERIGAILLRQARELYGERMPKWLWPAVKSLLLVEPLAPVWLQIIGDMRARIAKDREEKLARRAAEQSEQAEQLPQSMRALPPPRRPQRGLES